MLEGRLLGVRCRLSLLFPALLTGLLLAQPDGLALTCVLASAIHEMGHLLAMVAAGCPPAACTVGAFGVRLEMGARQPGYLQNIGISLAGPAVNVLSAGVLFLLCQPEPAAVHLVLAGLNLLPAAALDGGQVLRCVLCLLGQETRAGHWLRWLSAAVLLPLAAVAFWLFLSGRGNATLLIVSVYLTALVFFSPSV